MANMTRYDPFGEMVTLRLKPRQIQVKPAAKTAQPTSGGNDKS